MKPAWLHTHTHRQVKLLGPDIHPVNGHCTYTSTAPCWWDKTRVATVSFPRVGAASSLSNALQRGGLRDAKDIAHLPSYKGRARKPARIELWRITLGLGLHSGWHIAIHVVALLGLGPSLARHALFVRNPTQTNLCDVIVYPLPPTRFVP